MQTFKEFLTDVTGNDKNLHLEHIEDEILNFSYSGARDALSFVEAVAGTLAGYETSVEVTAKWDGSPAIFVGTNPENDKFFVATKGLFNKQPKINYTVEDIHTNHNGDLAVKLEAALTHLSPLHVPGILQGDLMFTRNDIRHQMIEGSEYVTFTPNTITYAVPVGTALGESVTNSELGIIFHTSYIGKDLSNLSASYQVDLSGMHTSDRVWYGDARHLDESTMTSFTHDELSTLNEHLSLAEKVYAALEQANLDALVDHPDIVKLIKMYTNKTIMVGTGHNIDSNQVVNGLIEYINERLHKEKEVLKTESAKDRRDKKREQLGIFIESERKTLELVFEFQKQIVYAKKVLLQKLDEVTRIRTFLEHDAGFRPTASEGFVVVDHQSNRAIKLVNRLEFSRANFHRNRK